MSLLSRSLLPAFICLALAACQRQAEPAETAAEPAASATPANATDPVILHQAMANVVKPQTEVILNTLINALTLPPDPYVDASKLTDSDWAIMGTAATDLRDTAIALRDRPIRVVDDPAIKLYGELELGTHNAVEVQGFVDAYPDHFQEDAESFRAKADEWLGAIQARDPVASWRIALEIDPICVDCHEVFWTGEPPHEHEEDGH